MSIKKWCKNSECPYFKRIEVPYTGPNSVEMLIVGESPGSEENRQQKPFVGPSGAVLNAVLKDIGIDRSDVMIANSCRCQILKESDGIKDQNIALKLCRQKLVKLIKATKPKVIVALGAFALKQLLGKQKIMENRGQFFYSEEFDCQVFVTVHPAYVLRGASRHFWEKPASKRSMKENLLFIDFGQVKKYLKEDKVDSLDTKAYRQGTSQDLVKMLSAKRVAVDFETTGLDLANPNVKVLSVALCDTEGKPVVFFAKRQKDQVLSPDGDMITGSSDVFPAGVRKILESEKIAKLVAARPFEERVCRKMGYEMKGPIHDVLAMAHLLDENGHSYGLEAIADIYTPLKGIKSLAQGMRHSLEELSKEDLLKYNAVDADATLRAYNVMAKYLATDPALARYYLHFLQKMQDMFADVYFNGGTIDTEQLGKDEYELQRIIEESKEALMGMLPDEIKKKHEKKLSVSRPEVIQDYLFRHPRGLRLKPHKDYLTPKTKKPQITEHHLKLFKGVPFIDTLLRMKKAEKILGTYIKNLWLAIKPDGLIYPSTIFTRTVTGRTVMAEPTIQTIPQRGEFAPYIKRAFVAPQGWLFGGRDLGQSEIRIMGWLAQDPVILKALKDKIDIHTMTACIVNKVTLEEFSKLPKAKQKEYRQKAKGVNFGFLYGMSAHSFRAYAKNNYNVEFTEEECEDLRQAFFSYPNGYYKLPRFHKTQGLKAMRDALVRSPLGRIRRLPDAQGHDQKTRGEALRQAINMPVQSFSSDLGLIGMYMFWLELKKRPNLAKKVRLMWFLHDAVYFTAREDAMPKAMLLLKKCMEKLSAKYIEEKFGVKIGYPITSDGKVGGSWATLADWDDEKGELKEKAA